MIFLFGFVLFFVVVVVVVVFFLFCFSKPATHLAILYADLREKRITSPISGMSDIGD